MKALNPHMPPPAKRTSAADAVRPTDAHAASAHVFARAFALLLASSFVALWWEFDVAVGSTGLLPLAMTAGSEPWGQFPTLLAWGASDPILYAWIGVGFLASTAAFARIRSTWSWGIALFCSWQMSMASPFMLGLPPDFVLFHGAIAAALMDHARTRTAGVWLARALFFGLYVEAGWTKWLDPHWQAGAGLDTFFAVTALPGWFARPLAELPGPVLNAAKITAVYGQMLVPFAIFAGARGRLLAALFFASFQLLLLAATNFGPLLWGALLLSLPLVDDRYLPASWARPAAADALSARFGRGVLGLFVAAWVVQGAIDITNIGRSSALRRTLEGWRLATRYAMFQHIPPLRAEPFFHLHRADGSVEPYWAAPRQVQIDDTGGRMLGPFMPRVPIFLWLQTTTAFELPWGPEAASFASDGPHSRPTSAMRYAAGWACRYLERTDPRGMPEAIAWAPTALDFAPSTETRWWSVTPLGVSEPVPCATLVAEATHPFASVGP